MSMIDPRLGEYEVLANFAAMVKRSPRTVYRWINREKDPLPHLPFGRDTLIPIPLAREWMERSIVQPNRSGRRARAA